MHEIHSGENLLTFAERVPSLISATPDKMNREVFKDCQKFFAHCQREGVPAVLACAFCLSKPFLPLACRAKPREGCFQEAFAFLKSFKQQLIGTADRYAA